MSSKEWKVGILLFNEVEVLDFAGPFEVFSVTEVDGKKPFIVKTISEAGGLISARNGLKVQPDFSFDDHAKFDIVIIPGGYGAEKIEINNTRVIDWIKKQVDSVDLLASVCTGAFLLAKAGILDGKKATTHWMDLDALQTEFPEIKVQEKVKFVQDGKIITAAGVSSGINMSLHIVSQLLNKETAEFAAKIMQYDDYSSQVDLLHPASECNIVQ